MPNIIIEEIVTNVELNIEEVVSTVTIQISEMQMPGISAYQVAVNNGFVGTEIEWIASLKGEQGLPGTTDHLALTNVGVKTHDQIDTDLTRLADTSGANTGDQDISGKEDKSNKKIDVETNKTSDTFYPSIKSIVDWVTNLFVKGSGTINYLPKFGVGGKVVGNSLITDDGTNVGIGGVPYGKLGVTSALGVSTQETLLCLNKSNTSDRSWKFIIGKNADTQWGSYGMRIFSVYNGDLVFSTGGRIRMGSGSPETADSLGAFAERFTILLNGNTGFGLVLPEERIHAIGNGKFTGSAQVGDNTAVASASNVGATRYRATANNSYLETCMQTSLSGYAWVIIKQNTW